MDIFWAGTGLHILQGGAGRAGAGHVKYGTPTLATGEGGGAERGCRVEQQGAAGQLLRSRVLRAAAVAACTAVLLEVQWWRRPPPRHGTSKMGRHRHKTKEAGLCRSIGLHQQIKQRRLPAGGAEEKET